MNLKGEKKQVFEIVKDGEEDRELKIGCSVFLFGLNTTLPLLRYT